MSQENVDFLSDLFTTVETLDKDELLAALPSFVEGTCDPEIEWVEDPERADGRVYRGHDGGAPVSSRIQAVGRSE